MGKNSIKCTFTYNLKCKIYLSHLRELGWRWAVTRSAILHKMKYLSMICIRSKNVFLNIRGTKVVEVILNLNKEFILLLLL